MYCLYDIVSYVFEKNGCNAQYTHAYVKPNRCVETKYIQLVLYSRVA